MAYTKVFNYLSTLMRSNDRKELILPPFSKNILVEPGYYSKCSEIVENMIVKNEEEIVLKERDYFELDGITYRKREEVFYTVNCNIGAFNSFIESMNFSKPEINGAELHAISERATNALWTNVKNRVPEVDHDAILNSKKFIVDGENPLYDIYGGVYSIIYYLMYYVVAENRCEPTKMLDLVKTNIENLDKFWGGNSIKEQQIRELLGGAVDVFINKYIAPHLTIETTKVGQAHVNENLSSIMAEYKDLKTKVFYIMGGQVDLPRYFIVLENYVNMVLGQEESFYTLLSLIMAENLHGAEESAKLQERLTVDDDQLENFLKRLIDTNLTYIANNEDSIKEIKRILEKPIATTASLIEESIKKFMEKQLDRMHTGYIRTPEYEKKLPISKIINTKSTTYTLIMSPKGENRAGYIEVTEWARELGRQLEVYAQMGIAKVTKEMKDGCNIIRYSLHASDKMELVIKVGEDKTMPPQITMVYESANLKSGQIGKLVWK